MGESYLSHSVLHEKVLTLRKLFVHLVHRPKVKSQESCRPDKTQGLCDPWSGGWALLRTFPTGLSTRLQCSTASQTATESYEDTINHVPDKKSGRGGWERRGALAGFYGTFAVRTPVEVPFWTLFQVSNRAALHSVPQNRQTRELSRASAQPFLNGLYLASASGCARTRRA